MRIHVDQAILRELDELTESLQELAEAEDQGWDYRLPEKFQDQDQVDDFQPLTDQGWDYRLPERYRY